MSNATINNLPVIEARLQLPRFGNWTADVAVDVATASQVAQGASAKLQLGGGQISFNGTVFRVDTIADTVALRLVGGANGLGQDTKPRFYSGVTVQNPLQDILSDAGETLSGTAQASVLATSLAFWTLVQQRASLALALLMRYGPADAVWRMLADGTLFVGVDGYPATQLSDFELIDYAPQDGMQLIAAEVPNVFPGESFNGQNVSAVEHVVNANGSRANVWFE